MLLYFRKKSLCPFFGPKGPKTVPTLGDLEIFEKKKSFENFLSHSKARKSNKIFRIFFCLLFDSDT